MDLAQFKDTQRQMWEEGDYRPVGRLLEPAAEVLVEAAGVRPGDRVLDVATGSGNVAIRAARSGAEVVGVDITEAWFGEARERAAAAGVHIDLLVGDAEGLPVDDASFDVVLSSFGAIFAPRHEVVTAELVRACRPGGTIALTAWTPSGANDEVFSTLTSQLPAPPDFVAPSIGWGEPAHVRGLFADHGITPELTLRTLPVAFPSPAVFEEFVFDNSGAFMRARRLLTELGRWEKVQRAFRDAVAATNDADDGSYRTTWEFGVIVATRPA